MSYCEAGSQRLWHGILVTGFAPHTCRGLVALGLVLVGYERSPHTRVGVWDNHDGQADKERVRPTYA